MSDETALVTQDIQPVATAESTHHYMRDTTEDRLWTTSEFPEHLFQKGYVVGGTARSLMRLSVALACMDVLSQDVAKAPLQMRRYLKNRRGSVLVGPGEHPLARLLDRRPSRYYGWNEMTKIMTIFLACSSEYFVAGRRNRVGDIIEVQGIDKAKVTINADRASRRYFYEVSPGSLHDEVQFGWARGRQSEDVVAHVRTRSLNGMDMLGTEKVAATAFELMSKMSSFQMNIFGNGGMGPMAFMFPDRMTPEQWTRLKADIEHNRDKALREGKPFILEGNGAETNNMPKVEKLGLSSVDTDFVKANEAAAIEICRAFRVPPHKVFLLNSVKYDNQDAQERQYLETSLVPYFRAIEQSLEAVLLTEQEREDYCLAFDMDAAAGMSREARQKDWESKWTKGMCEYDEMREGVGLNAIGGKAGRVRMISGNFVLIDEKNEVILRAGGNVPGAEGGQAPQEDAGKKGVDPAVSEGQESNVVNLR